MFAGAAKLGNSGVHEWSFRVERGTENTFGIVDAQYDPRTGAEMVILRSLYDGGRNRYVSRSFILLNCVVCADGYINKRDHGWGLFQKGQIGNCRSTLFSPPLSTGVTRDENT